MVAPALTISMFNLRRDQPIAPRSLDLRTVTTRTHGGLVLEMGDAQQHGGFEAFARHIDTASSRRSGTRGRSRLDVAYRSDDLLKQASPRISASPTSIISRSIRAPRRAIPYG